MAMAIQRFKALEEVLSRIPIDAQSASGKVSEYFGTHVFGKDAMNQYLSEEAFITVMSAIETGNKIDRKMAEHVANGMKAWALSKGATHYTHWFQPLTGTTAEKHDAFFTPTEGGRAMEN